MSQLGISFRILPMTMAIAMLFLGVKISQIADGRERLQDILVRQAVAQEATEKKTEEAKAEAEDEKESAEEVAEKAEEEIDEEEAKREQIAKIREQDILNKKEKQNRQYNNIELDILQSLSSRREEIEKWAEEVQIREQVLQATELRIDDKIDKMQALKGQVETLLETYKKEQKTELRSLVKIYENMKAKDAARIFNELDMDILLDVVDLMSERKAAPVLAGMDPTKAKDLTVELAARRRLQKNKMPDDMPL